MKYIDVAVVCAGFPKDTDMLFEELVSEVKLYSDTMIPDSPGV